MGMYTGLRFKGVVKEEFRDNFEMIALDGEWKNHSDKHISRFGLYDRASFIPCGLLAYMPEEWDENDEFEQYYNNETGYWVFQCSLKNYNATIERFLEILPYFIDSVEYCEYYYEEWAYSHKYELIRGDMKLTNREFIYYAE